jgi:hypothetical protein
MEPTLQIGQRVPSIASPITYRQGGRHVLAANRIGAP